MTILKDLDEQLKMIRERVHQTASNFKRLSSAASTLNFDDRPPKGSIPPLRLESQSFLSTIDGLHLPPDTYEGVKNELQKLITGYTTEFERACHILSAHHPSKASLASMLERLAKLIHARLEREKSSLLEMLIAHFGQSSKHDENKRPFNHAYTPVLEKYFEFNERPSAADQVAMAEKSGMSRRQIEVWFQNRRRRMKQQFGDKRTPRYCPGFSDENISRLQRGLPDYLLQTGADNTVDLVERVVSAEWEAETRDLRQEKKYASFHEPQYPRNPHAPNPLDAHPSHSDLPSFKPSQFQDLMKRPRDRLPEPQWSRRPYVSPLTATQHVKKPCGRVAQIAKANAHSEPPSEMQILTKRFDEDFHIDNSGVPDEFRVYYFGRGPHLPPAATYAKDVRPPMGRHPAFVVPGSKEIPGGLLPPPAVIPTKRKKAGLPKRSIRRGETKKCSSLELELVSLAGRESNEMRGDSGSCFTVMDGDGGDEELRATVESDFASVGDDGGEERGVERGASVEPGSVSVGDDGLPVAAGAEDIGSAKNVPEKPPNIRAIARLEA
ncbi:hypothetical protein L218DRAFT_983067 [Marasmius fiardii PR-910]|nr:hypothetical protein L218DRAFT_983067 [Marasmius fiardii PR-910]